MEKSTRRPPRKDAGLAHVVEALVLLADEPALGLVEDGGAADEIGDAPARADVAGVIKFPEQTACSKCVGLVCT